MQCVHKISGIQCVHEIGGFFQQRIQCCMYKLVHLYCFSFTFKKRMHLELVFQNFYSFCHVFKHVQSLLKDFPYHRLASRSWTEPFQSCLNYGSFGSFSVSLDSVDSNNMLKLKCFSSIETSFAMQTCKIFEGHRKCDYKKGRVKRPFSSFMQIQNLLIFYHFFFASFRKICNCITELAFVINMQFNNVFIKSTYYILQIANHSSFPLLQI